MMPMFMGGPQMMGPQMCMGGGFGANPMQMQMQMMMLQMMQMMMTMMGQMGGQMGPQNPFQQGYQDGMNAARMGNMMGNNFMPPMGGMPYGGMPMGCPPGGYQNFCPPPGYGGGQPNFGPCQANPGAQIPNFGPNPSKAQINTMIEAACQKYGVPPEIAKAVAYKESGWNPRASSFDGGHGKGIMQIDDRSHNFAKGPQVWDPAANIDYGVRLLAQNFKRAGNWRDATRRYNGSGPMAERYANSVMNLSQQRPWTKFGVN